MLDRKRSIVAVATVSFALCLLVSAHAGADVGSDWNMYNGDYSGQRYSLLKQITIANVAKLHPICAREIAEGQTLQAGIIVRNGILLVTTAHDTWALDAANCRVRWHVHQRALSYEINDTNRGVALAGSSVIRGTPGGHLVAFALATGRVLWDVTPADAHRGEFLSSAPLAWNQFVYIGTAGGDVGVKGRMMAFDSASGRLRWTFTTIPTGHQTGALSWGNAASAATGGGAMWSSYTIDRRRAELFVPVGNPAPDFAGSERPGENLFTDSLVVLDARNGKLKWWYQLVKHDVLDADLAAPPMLYSVGANAMVALGGKDGHLYSISRTTHKAVFKIAVTTIANAAQGPASQGTHICPGYVGGVEWNGPAFDVLHRFVLVNAVDWCGKYVLREPPHSIYERVTQWLARFLYERRPHPVGSFFYDGYFLPDPARAARGWLTAVDARSGQVRWKYHAASPLVAAVTPTAGGLVFTGDLLGNFLALNSRSGKILFEGNTGGSIAGGVVTYSVAGQQFIAVTSGNLSRTGLGIGGRPTVFILGLGRSLALVRPKLSPAITSLDTRGGATGKVLHGADCAACHGPNGVGGGTGPRLQNERLRKDLGAIRVWIENPDPPMPKLYPDRLTGDDVTSIAKYVESL